MRSVASSAQGHRARGSLPDALQDVAQLRSSLAQLHDMHAQLERQARWCMLPTAACVRCGAMVVFMHAV